MLSVFQGFLLFLVRCARFGLLKIFFDLLASVPRLLIIVILVAQLAYLSLELQLILFLGREL